MTGGPCSNIIFNSAYFFLIVLCGFMNVGHKDYDVFSM